MRRNSRHDRSSTARRGARWSALAGAALLAVLPTVGVADAAPEARERVAARQCAYYEAHGSAYWNHCTTDGSWIVIKLDVVLGRDEYRCVGPGVTRLGPAAKYRGASYEHRLCG